MSTKHTHGPNFGKREADCPRCVELDNGAEPVRWAGHSRKADDEQRSREIVSHFASERHRSGGCGPVCTFGDW